MNIGIKIKNKRKELNLTMFEVAQKTGVSEATVSRWESGDIANMRRDKIVALANALQVTPSYLMDLETDTDNIEDIPGVFVPTMRRVALLGTIACGEPILARENLDGEVVVPDDIRADFALRCKGDSMIDARIMDGDIVYIRQQPVVENGEIAAVLIDDEATLKRVYLSENTITLMACNAKFQPLVYTGSQLEEVRIIGKAVGFTSAVV